MADYQYITTTGVIVPDTSTVLTEVQDEYKAAFGQDLVVTPDTPQGVLITAETLARDAVINNNAAVANQINPNIAGGIFLDAIMSLTGMQRVPQTQTLVESVALTGQPGTLIPEGVQAKTANGDLFSSTGDVTLDGGGTGTINFVSIAFGPIPCPVDGLNTIVTGVIGWETVNNDNAGILGATTQSDQAARALRQNTLGFQGLSLAEAITSALYATDGVTSLQFRENIAPTTQTIDGIVMVSHSVYACVNGGTDSDVAAALLENKSSGAAWNGGTTVSVMEPASGQTYTVLFDRPSEIGILIKATIKNGSADEVTQAILDGAAGNINGEVGFVVGQDVSPFEIAAWINEEVPGIYVQKVEISIVYPISWQVTPIEIAIDEVAHTQFSYITIVIAS